MDLLTKEVLLILQSELDDLEGVYVFGSRATGQSGKDSDWDFGYLSRKGLSNTRKWEVVSELGAKYDTHVDLYSASTILQIEVLKNGDIIWQCDKVKTATFEYLALSYYQKLNEERAEILQDVKARGNIHG